MVVVALLFALCFGAGDQYLGSLSAHPWGADISGLSAPWLVLPFVVGALQRGSRRAALLGVACTFAALCGYCLMTLSPVENAHFSWAGIVAFLRSGNARWFIAGMVTGPLFGWAGYRWRSGRVVVAGLLAALVLAFEPLARAAYGNAIRSPRVWLAEAVAGVLLAAFVLLHRRDAV